MPAPARAPPGRDLSQLGLPCWGVDSAFCCPIPDSLPLGSFVETDPPAVVAPGEVVVLDVRGSLFFAGAPTLAEALPPPGGPAPVVVLRLLGRTSVGRDPGSPSSPTTPSPWRRPEVTCSAR